jgi:hypothetical protein
MNDFMHLFTCNVSVTVMFASLSKGAFLARLYRLTPAACSLLKAM